jgi:hypothetical protein
LFCLYPGLRDNLYKFVKLYVKWIIYVSCDSHLWEWSLHFQLSFDVRVHVSLPIFPLMSTPRLQISVKLETRYPLYSRLGRPRDRCGWIWKISTQRGSKAWPSNPQLVAIPAHAPYIYLLLHSMVQQPLVNQALLIIDASRSHSDTPHSVGLLWTSDQPDAETSTSEHSTPTRDRHPCPRRDSNPQSQEASGRTPTS